MEYFGSISQKFAERDSTELSPELRELGDSCGAFEPNIGGSHRVPLATAADFYVDRAGRTAAALREADLAKEIENELTERDTARGVAMTRIEQALICVERTVNAIALFLYTSAGRPLNEKDLIPATLGQRVQLLRDLSDSGRIELDWSHLVDKFEANLMDIEIFYRPEILCPGSSTLAELAEFRFSLISSYTHAIEFVADSFPGFVAPELPPEMSVFELCIDLGIHPIIFDPSPEDLQRSQH